MIEGATAWLSEHEEWEVDDATSLFGGPGDIWFTGRFWGHVDRDRHMVERFDDLELDEALAWARARADRVLILLGGDDQHYEAGLGTVGDLPRWPPPGLDLPLRRRRPEGERWKDRTPDDSPIAWRVIVALRVPFERYEELLTDRRRLDTEAAEIVERSEAESWDAGGVDGFVADVRTAARAAGDGEVFGWNTGHAPAWRLRLTVTAPTRGEAAAAALSRVGDPDGWELAAAAEPA